MKIAKNTLPERFWKKVVKTDGCWKWTATKHKGYGMIRLGGILPKVAASRASWIVHFGSIPEGMHVLHHCDNPECTNPTHLFLGTHADNMKDKESKNRARPEGWLESVKLNALLRKKLTPHQESKIYELHISGTSIHELSRTFNIDRNAIRKIIKST